MGAFVGGIEFFERQLNDIVIEDRYLRGLPYMTF